MHSACKSCNLPKSQSSACHLLSQGNMLLSDGLDCTKLEEPLVGSCLERLLSQFVQIKRKASSRMSHVQIIIEARFTATWSSYKILSQSSSSSSSSDDDYFYSKTTSSLMPRGQTGLGTPVRLHIPQYEDPATYVVVKKRYA